MIFPPDELPNEELYPYVTLPPALVWRATRNAIKPRKVVPDHPVLTGRISQGYLDCLADRLTKIMNCSLLLIGTLTHLNARNFVAALRVALSNWVKSFFIDHLRWSWGRLKATGLSYASVMLGQPRVSGVVLFLKELSVGTLFRWIRGDGARGFRASELAAHPWKIAPGHNDKVRGKLSIQIWYNQRAAKLTSAINTPTA
jgi:hypothetical protein